MVALFSQYYLETTVSVGNWHEIPVACKPLRLRPVSNQGSTVVIYHVITVLS